MADQMIADVKRELRRRKKSASWLAGEIGVSRMSMSRWLRKLEPLPEQRAKQIAGVLDLERKDG